MPPCSANQDLRLPSRPILFHLQSAAQAVFELEFQDLVKETRSLAAVGHRSLFAWIDRFENRGRVDDRYPAIRSQN